MAFEAYMRLALYHPGGGYYASRVPGQGSDYGTSPSLTRWYGRLVVRELRAMWEALGRPDPFTVTEVGAGRADLAAGALEAAGPLSGALRWRIVEQFEAVAALQQARLGEAAAGVEWVPSVGAAPVTAGCVLAHEVIDNFPVHLLEVGADGQASEVHVDWDGSRLVERLGPVSPAIARAAQDNARRLRAGQRFEVCPAVEAWCAEAGSSLQTGYLLVIDYGDVEPDLWARSPAGTIVTYGPDGFGRDPYADPGDRDITADVNFSALGRSAEQAAFRPQLFGTQRDWLTSLGVDQVVATLEAEAERAWTEGRTGDGLGLEEEASQVRTLVGHMGLGDIMVWRGAKGAPAPEVRPGRAW